MRLIDADAIAFIDGRTGHLADFVYKLGIKNLITIDPVHAAGGCYCRECRMRSGVETKETVLCGYHGCSMRKDDFCSMGKREESGDGEV